MKLLVLQTPNDSSAFEVFLDSVSNKLAAAVCKKLMAYIEADAIPMSNGLKILKPKIWGYKGTIYKLRVDCGKESARVMFTKSVDNDLVLLHGFVKRSQKTPAKDAKIAISNLERLTGNAAVVELSLAKYLTSDSSLG